MQRSLEQRYAIKFCMKLRIWFWNVAVVEDSLWGCCFIFIPSPQVVQGVQGWEGGHWGRPSTSRTKNNVARVKAVLDRDRRLSVRLMEEEVGLPKTDVHRIITEDLHMRKICAKLVPKNLSDGFSETLGSCDKWAQLSAASDNRRWNLGFRVWSHNQKTEFRVAHFPLTLTEKGPNEQIKNEIHAHYFLLLKGNSSQGVCASPTDCESNILPTGTRVFKKQSCARPPWNCKHVVPSTRQRTKSHIICCEGIFGST